MTSVARVGQTRALDASRVSRHLGTLTSEEYVPVHVAMRLIIGLSGEADAVLRRDG